MKEYKAFLLSQWFGMEGAYLSLPNLHTNLELYMYYISASELLDSSLVPYFTLAIYRSPLKNGPLKNELENVPPPLGKRVRKQMRPRTQPQANLSSPKGVISSFAGTSSPPRKKVANNPHAKQRTLPLRPPIPSKSEVAKDSRVAVLLPNIACAIRPPSSLPQGNKFREVTTIPADKIVVNTLYRY